MLKGEMRALIMSVPWVGVFKVCAVPLVGVCIFPFGVTAVMYALATSYVISVPVSPGHI